MKKNISLHSDIVIIGGGLVGLTQSISLANAGFNIICLDADTQNNSDTNPHQNRTTAISYGSQKILEKIGVWQDIAPHSCAIADIQILDGPSPVLLDLKIEEDFKAQAAGAFGWVVQNKYIRDALIKAVQTNKNISYKTGQRVQDFNYHDTHIDVILDKEILHTTLVIGADGRQSMTREWMGVGVREWSYHQRAIVAVITHEKPHQNIAIEHFRREGPFAILPMQDDEKGCHRSSIVWTEENNASHSIADFSDDVFLTALNARFPEFYGRITAFKNRMTYPLGFVHAYSYIVPRMALIGDAAHGIHPIAGQGLNLGLRDVATLSQLLAQTKTQNQDIGDLKILAKYQILRRPDNTKMAVATDLLNGLFSNDNTVLRGMRKMGMVFMNKLKPAKKIIISQAMGTSRHTPQITDSAE